MMLALIFVVVRLVTCQTTTVPIFFPVTKSVGTVDLVGSIVGNDASKTTYVVGCASSSSNSTAAATSMGLNSTSSDSGNNCWFDESQTMTQGPSTYHWVIEQTELYV